MSNEDVSNEDVLDDNAIARYARQIVVPGIGAAGQQKLLSSTVLIVGNGRGCDQAQLYLRAAGVRVLRAVTPGGLGDADVVVVADATTLDEPMRRALLERDTPICWYAVEENAFTAGVHPTVPLPLSRNSAAASADAAVHDAAACDAAAVACAILIGLPQQSGPFRIES